MLLAYEAESEIRSLTALLMAAPVHDPRQASAMLLAQPVAPSFYPRQPGEKHITTDAPEQLACRRPLAKLPRYIPENYTQKDYSALYHTDVLIPTDVTIDGTIDPEISRCEHWKYLRLDYITEKVVPENHVNYALFHGHPINHEAMFHNPWPPRRAFNSPLFD